MDIGLAGGSYEDDPAVHQSTINLYPSMEEVKSRSRHVLKRTPGIENVVGSLGGDLPCRAFVEVNDVAYVVFGEQLYVFSGGGFAVAVSGGIIPGTQRLTFAVGGDFVVLVNAAGAVYGYNTDTGVFAEVTDGDLPLVGDVVYLDGYFIYAEREFSNTRQFFVSAINDPYTIDGLDFATKESDAHNIRALHVSHGDLFILGRRRTEVWRNVGNNLFPFQRIDGSEMDRGIGARDTAEEIDNTFMFVGDDMIVYRVNGYVPQRVSNHGVENYLDTLDSTERLSMFAQSYSRDGHYFYCLTAGDRTFVYDATFSAQVGQAIWHERRSHPGTGSIDAVTPWRVAFIAELFDRIYIGDSLTGSIGYLSDTHLEFGEAMKWSRTTAPIYADNDLVAVSKLEIRLEGGGNIGMESSRDGGDTWTVKKERDMTKRVIYRRLGKALERIFRLSGTDPVTLVSGHADLEAQS